MGNASIRRGMADRSQTGTRKARVTTNDNRGDSKNNGPRGGGPLNRIRAVGSYWLAVASSNGRFVAVVDVTVMSPLAPIVYTRPFVSVTAVRVILFVVESG